MYRRHSIHPREAEASFIFLSSSGDQSYRPAGYDADLTMSIDDSRLPRSTTLSTSFARSPSVPAVASLGEADTQRRPSSQPSDGLSDQTRLGLPENWLIFPVSRRAGQSSAIPPDQHLHTIDFGKFDFTRSLEFSLSAESLGSNETLPAYRSRANSCGQLEDTLPPYRVDDELSSVVEAIYAQNAQLLKKPKLKPSRPLPREFSEQELREIRRRTRHRIRVVTRNSLGLTVGLCLSCVAPQMLIAAAINGFCLGRGAHKLRQHLHFLEQNELKVQKRDVAIAVVEGVVVKLIFLAITLNGDDILVLTHELVSAHADTVAPILHELPGFTQAHDAFMVPIEKIQEMLGLPTMAQRALEFGSGGWFDPADMVLKNMFLVGAVQTVMETAIDRAQDRLSKTSDRIREHHAHKRIMKEREQVVEGAAWSGSRGFGFPAKD
jgi:flavin-binding protein dodecin